MEKRACPFCGKPIASTLSRCPYCREAVPHAAAVGSRVNAINAGQARTYLRRGLLWALLAGVLYYFGGGHSGLTLPVEIPAFVPLYLTPLLFLAGAGMACYGLILQLKS